MRSRNRYRARSDSFLLHYTDIYKRVTCHREWRSLPQYLHTYMTSSIPPDDRCKQNSKDALWTILYYLHLALIVMFNHSTEPKPSTCTYNEKLYSIAGHYRSSSSHTARCSVSRRRSRFRFPLTGRQYRPELLVFCSISFLFKWNY